MLICCLHTAETTGNENKKKKKAPAHQGHEPKPSRKIGCPATLTVHYYRGREQELHVTSTAHEGHGVNKNDLRHRKLSPLMTEYVHKIIEDIFNIFFSCSFIHKLLDLRWPVNEIFIVCNVAAEDLNPIVRSLRPIPIGILSADYSDARWHPTAAQVRRLAQKHRANGGHRSDVESTELLLKTPPFSKIILFFQQPSQGHPLIIVIQDDWQRDAIAKLKRRPTVVAHLDATGATTRYGYMLSVLLLEATDGTGIPIAHFVTSDESSDTIACALSKIKDKSKFAPHGAMIDQSDSEKAAIKKTWPACTILVCLFHVQQAVMRKAKTLVPEKHHPDVLEYVRLMAFASNEKAFLAFKGMFFAFCAAANLRDFQAYFVNEWLKDGGKPWTRYDPEYARFIVRTNNLSEGHFKVIIRCSLTQTITDSSFCEYRR